MKIILLVEGARHTVDLTEEGTTIGRGVAADIRINSNAVSRVACQVLPKDGQVWVMDTNSLNGTSLNDVPVREPMPHAPGRHRPAGRSARAVGGGGPRRPSSRRRHQATPEVKIALEDRALDPSGSIWSPTPASRPCWPSTRPRSPPEVVESLFQRLAAMAGSCWARPACRAAGFGHDPGDRPDPLPARLHPAHQPRRGAGPGVRLGGEARRQRHPHQPDHRPQGHDATR